MRADQYLYSIICSTSGRMSSGERDLNQSAFRRWWKKIAMQSWFQRIVCALPYIIAFTTDSIEIRLLVNGNLIHIYSNNAGAAPDFI